MYQESVSVLSKRKKKEIIDNLLFTFPKLKQHRAEHKTLMSIRIIDLSEPAWVRVNPGPSSKKKQNSYRLCIGFQNIGCKYRERDLKGLGCLMCGYYARTAFKNVEKHMIVEQFKFGLIKGYREATKFDSIEFLNDGSFLNPDEFDKETQLNLLNLVSRMRYIKRVLVESRPEYIKESTLKFVLNQLRKDQLLEVAIGIESADDFIRDHCINKGITRKDFENAILEISHLAKGYPKRISAVAYLLIKPPFLTQRESIDDAVATINYLRQLSVKHKIHITAKLEPAAIANGTILSLLYQDNDNKFKYEPLSYWAVLEILARVACEIGTDAIEIRVGSREDMDDILKIPAIYNNDGETFHPVDFVLYESIQKFNQHQDLCKTLAVILEVVKRSSNISLVNNNSSLMQWYKRNKIAQRSIIQFLSRYKNIIEKKTNIESIKYDIDLMSIIYAVLDIMEGYCMEANDLKKNIDSALKRKDKKNLGLRIDECFKRIAPQAILQSSVIDINFNTQYGEVFFDVKDLLEDTKVSIWSRFAFHSGTLPSVS